MARKWNQKIGKCVYVGTWFRLCTYVHKCAVDGSFFNNNDVITRMCQCMYVMYVCMYVGMQVCRHVSM